MTKYDHLDLADKLAKRDTNARPLTREDAARHNAGRVSRWCSRCSRMVAGIEDEVRLHEARCGNG